MSPTKTNASESSRQRKASTQKPRKAFKQRKIPKTLDGVPLCHYGAKIDDFVSGDATIQPPVVSESVVPLHVTTPQDLDFPPAGMGHSQIPASTRVYRGEEPSHVPIPFQFDFNGQSMDNMLSMTNNPCQSYGRYANDHQSCEFIPSLSSSTGTGSLSMDYGVEAYQQWPDPNTQYSIPQSILSYASNASFPGNSYDIYADFMSTAGSSHLTMTSANDRTSTLPFPNYDANNSHGYYI